eukprot:4754497-Pleurochrysis_carterae.AAC.4
MCAALPQYSTSSSTEAVQHISDAAGRFAFRPLRYHLLLYSVHVASPSAISDARLGESARRPRG